MPDIPRSGDIYRQDDFGSYSWFTFYADHAIHFFCPGPNIFKPITRQSHFLISLSIKTDSVIPNIHLQHIVFQAQVHMDFRTSRILKGIVDRFFKNKVNILPLLHVRIVLEDFLVVLQVELNVAGS